ncbi:hypothetical protein BVC80_1569g7 [Macleaya cordata]|uniref:Uncharacterized protein n=1 Tax=Macleaya cordata TaxID=56857 RepID=A0A200QTT3_MACCD|nr:hypothetical protein BVC80_1569g7 [Macleaya cordata]
MVAKMKDLTTFDGSFRGHRSLMTVPMFILVSHLGMSRWALMDSSVGFGGYRSLLTDPIPYKTEHVIGGIRKDLQWVHRWASVAVEGHRRAHLLRNLLIIKTAVGLGRYGRRKRWGFPIYTSPLLLFSSWRFWRELLP